MTDHPTPDSFDDRLGARLHDAADAVDGPGVTRASIAAAVDRRRRTQVRNRSLAVGAAAVIAVLGGIAVVTQTGGAPTEQVRAGQPTTTVLEPCDAPSTAAVSFWFRLSDAQAEVLFDAGIITEEQAAPGGLHLVRLTYRDVTEHLTSPAVGPIGQQLLQMGAIDPAVLQHLRDQGLLTAAQETTIADGVMPELDAAQADAVFEQFADLTAFPGGGEPLVYLASSGEDPGSGPETEVASGTEGSITTTTFAGAEGGTPFQEWVAVLRAKGLLSPAQEEAAAAGKGFSLTEEQSAALQEYWDEQAAGTTTTALAFAGGDEPTGTPATPATTAACSPSGPAATTTAPITTTTGR